jgi:Zn-finger nucleic acid-binding protein
VTAAPPQKCPRCSEALAQVELKGVGVQSCPKCTGTLLTQPRLATVLEAMSYELLKSFNPDAKLEALPDRGAGLDCPRCERPMTNDDYCGAHLVYFDRCESCGLLWIDADELGTMTLMWARMDARYAREHTAGEHALAQTDSVVAGVLVGRAVRRMFFGGPFSMGGLF